MKKVIMCGTLEQDIQSNITGKAFELYQCEKYIDDSEVFELNDDPIIDCVENDILNHGCLDGYEWDLDTDYSINYRHFPIGEISHILYLDGQPNSIYWIDEVE